MPLWCGGVMLAGIIYIYLRQATCDLSLSLVCRDWESGGSVSMFGSGLPDISLLVVWIWSLYSFVVSCVSVFAVWFRSGMSTDFWQKRLKWTKSNFRLHVKQICQFGHKSIMWVWNREKKTAHDHLWIKIKKKFSLWVTILWFCFGISFQFLSKSQKQICAQTWCLCLGWYCGQRASTLLSAVVLFSVAL